ncbi:NAD(P)H:quinone oxidoreductase [Nocardioides sp. ChNu-153]|uniref:NAD(P)H:quinone oxidoreductase n=1 Tax=Nocardioides sp. ChNu-153 TaxID=2779364 RepID=UPI00264DC310|nr:NAD(P)H:quinone oxidoreductase [Nocardioides sp. ChNu-153]MDN7123186.1 NAD(P)H:quinone oxidoreductase [Nocardioides sp. ChNu-153]
MTKIAIIYYSSTGTVDAMARRAAATAEAAGHDVRLRHVAELAPQEAIESQDAWVQHRRDVADEPVATPDDLDWADVALFGSPTRYGHITSQLQAYIDTLGPLWAQGKLADKVYAGFTASQTKHGGQESTLLNLYTSFYHFGGIVVAPGYTDPQKFSDGNPYGVGKVTGASAELDDDDLAAIDHLVNRTAAISRRLEAGGNGASRDDA